MSDNERGEERRFLRSLGPGQRYGGLWFIELEDPSAPLAREIWRILTRRFSGDTGAYLQWLHAPHPGLGGECPHELLAGGDLESVLALLQDSEQ